MPHEKLCQYPMCPNTMETGNYCPQHKPKQAKAHGAGRTYRTKRWRYTRAAVFQRDGYKCQMCGRLIGESPQCDHIIPIAQGGTDDEDNLQTLCIECHAGKTAGELA